MPERHQDWIRQARLDLDHARLAAREGHLEWAVIAAQQAAEKACKALHLRPSLSSVRVRYLDRDGVLASLRELALRLGAERPEVLEIPLVRLARAGERNPFADADLLIVLNASDLPIRDRLPRYKPTRIPAEALPGDVAVPADLIEAASRLDKHYIPARYPNGFASGYPGKLYTRGEAEGAIADAQKILEFCRRRLP